MSTVRSGAAIAFKNILFLTDFSHASSGALAYSLAFARHFKARLFPAHVMDPVLPESGTVPGEKEVKDEEERKQRQLSRMVEYNGISFQPLLSRCDFEVAMSHWISEHGIDLIVVGTHGRNGVQRFLLGSTSEVVLHNATCPVLTIGPHVEARRTFSLTLDNILFATELAARSNPAIEYALALATERQAQLTLLHVLPEDSRNYPDRTRVLRFAMDEMQRLLPDNASSFCKTELAVDAGDPAERIVQHARDEKADLIVMGLAGSSDFSSKGSFGVTYRVAGAAPCPVFSVPAAMQR
ncbi:MAG TPA: universal stress protein [Candidatus Angelobacter sp.]|nr:universal stress protein [Candidatus Angelobacter sp.]